MRGQIWPGATAWVVLLHDVGPDEDLDRWRLLLPSLLAEHLSVLAVDLRGHGASDGEWRADAVAGDIAATIRFVRERSDDPVVIVAAGRSAVDALWAAEREGVGGVVLLSATFEVPGPGTSSAGSGAATVGEGAGSSLPRAPGIAKLFLVGAQDTRSRQTTASLHSVAIGWAVVITLPTGEHATELLMGSTAGHAREQILGFLRACRFLARSATKDTGPPPDAAKAYLSQLGITVKGGEA
jgi:pimeloyl-ACP methyl ester carboxylesterase